LQPVKQQGTHDFSQMRAHMVDSQLRPNSVTSDDIVAAFREVPREAFVPKDMLAFAYLDEDIEVAPGRFMMEPLTLGRLIEFAEPRNGEKALVIGGTTGYSAAVLAMLALDVVLLEDGIEPAVAISRVPNLKPVSGPLNEGYGENGPYDLILIEGRIDYLPDTILSQVKEGGRVAAVIMDEGTARAGIGRVFGGHIGWTFVSDAGVAPLPGFAKEKGFAF
jgi:protein-L-isoaspartate(D-aspartate) O-methyltransferase